MEFEDSGYNFRIDKFDAFRQLHLSRKIAPLLPPLAPLLVEYVKMSKGDLLSTQILEIAELAEPFALALAGMKNEDAEEIMMLALSAVKVQTDAQKNVWMPLWNSAARMATIIEFNDLGKLLPIVIKVVQFNLGNFTAALLTRHEESHPAPSGGHSPAGKTG